MTLWIVAAVAGALLLAAIGFFALAKSDQDEVRDTRPSPERGRIPWDKQPDEPAGSRLATIPPPSGVPMAPTPSEEMPLSMESDALWLTDDDPTGPVPRIVVRATGSSDPGRKRRHNEDALLVLPEHEVYAVADGMGGYAAGEIAAAMAVQTLDRAFASGEFGTLEPGFPRRGAELMSAIRTANRRIRQESKRDPRKSGMGTTIVAARFSPGRKRAYIAHVGDSRCYRLRDGELTQLTQDHTLAAVGMTGPSAGKLSRAVGVFEDVDVELSVDEPLPGDHYLLCSDGLYKMIPAQMIEHTLASTPALDEAVRTLIAEANARGGRDNITVVLIRIDDPATNLRESGEHRRPG